MSDLNFVKLKKNRFFWHLKVGSNLNFDTARRDIVSRGPQGVKYPPVSGQ